MIFKKFKWTVASYIQVLTGLAVATELIFLVIQYYNYGKYNVDLDKIWCEIQIAIYSQKVRVRMH